MLTKLALTAALAFGMAGMAGAETLHWHAKLTAKQETKAKKMEAGASGTARGTLDTDTGKLTWVVKWTGLSGPATAMHFHGPAAVGKDAGVQVNIGKTSGLTSPSKGHATITKDQMGQLEQGQWYVNVHSAENPDGEIRGQVMVAKKK